MPHSVLHTPPTIDEVKQAIIEDLYSGISSATVDGQTTTLMDPAKRLEALKELEADEVDVVSTPTMGMRFTKLIPPGGGG